MRSLLLIFFTLCLHTLLNAQTTDTTTRSDKPKVAVTQRAAQQLKRLEKQLHLTQDQVLQLQVILINRDIALDSIQRNSTGDRRIDGRARREIGRGADTRIGALLTDEQKAIYQQWKEKQRAKNRARQAAKNGTPPSDQPQNPSEQPR